MTDRLREAASQPNWQPPEAEELRDALDADSPSEKQKQIIEKVRVYAALTFWYGLRLEEILVMPRNLLSIYVNELPALLADYQQMLIMGGSFAWMGKSDQRKITNELRRTKKKATPKGESTDLSQLSPRMREKMFHDMGFGYEEVKPDA